MSEMVVPSGRASPQSELLPCPFCGSDVISTEADGTQGLKWGYAYCGSCGVRGPEVRTSYDSSSEAPWRKTAFTEWNRRPMPECKGEAEGLAAQLYVQSTKGAPFVWWHLLRDDLKRRWRSAALKQIADFQKRNPHPLDDPPLT